MEKTSPYNLQDVDFPECARRCNIVGLLGVSECDSVCPWKSEDGENNEN
jgi:hypothetical protein